MVSFTSTALLSLLTLLGQAGANNHNNGTHCKGTSGVIIPGINTNNVTYFHCPETTRQHLSQQELQCAMNDFAHIFYTEKNVTKAFNKYVASNYVQHNPNFADGRPAAIAALTPLFGGNTTSLQLARVMVGPEYTTIHIKATDVGGPNLLNVMDVYRTQGSCIIEHWDCLEPVTIDNTTVNPHPYF